MEYFMIYPYKKFALSFIAIALSFIQQIPSRDVWENIQAVNIFSYAHEAEIFSLNSQKSWIEVTSRLKI